MKVLLYDLNVAENIIFYLFLFLIKRTLIKNFYKLMVFNASVHLEITITLYYRISRCMQVKRFVDNVFSPPWTSYTMSNMTENIFEVY
jgi:hypothetical protein